MFRRFVKKLFAVCVGILIGTLFFYGAAYTVMYADTFTKCVERAFPHAEVTYNLHPYCSAYLDGIEYVFPLRIIMKLPTVEEAIQKIENQSAPGTPG